MGTEKKQNTVKKLKAHFKDNKQQLTGEEYLRSIRETIARRASGIEYESPDDAIAVDFARAVRNDQEAAEHLRDVFNKTKANMEAAADLQHNGQVEAMSAFINEQNDLYLDLMRPATEERNLFEYIDAQQPSSASDIKEAIQSFYEFEDERRVEIAKEIADENDEVLTEAEVDELRFDTPELDEEAVKALVTYYKLNKLLNDDLIDAIMTIEKG